VIAYSRLGLEQAIIEVGAGTGKATRLFASAGREIVALEPSAEMLEVARAACRDWSSVRFVQCDFESWVLPQRRFGLLISAQAWHWITHEVRYQKARAALERGAALAAFWSYPDWGPVALRTALEDAYEEAYHEAGPNFSRSRPMHPSSDAREQFGSGWEAEISAAAGFDYPETRTYRWVSRYSAEQYVRLLATHSDHVMLDAEVRKRLFDRVQAAIEAHGGQFDLPYVTRLCLARAV
jgi:SAM-dependent methyltransferase